MRFCISKCTLRDFKEYRGKHILRLSDQGVHYIRGRNHVDAIGSNGAGKSSLWDAVSWCLTGRTTRGLRGTDVRTWEGGKHAKVSLAFTIDDASHVLKRSTEKNGLWLDGEITSQDAIDRLIGIKPLTLLHTIILGQKRELFFDLQPAAKLQILSESLALDKWNVRSMVARDKRADCKFKIIEFESQAKGHEQALEIEREELDSIRKQFQEWEEQRARGSDERASKLKKLKKAFARFEEERGTHDLAYDRAETELRALRRDIPKKDELRAEAQDRYNAMVLVCETVQGQITDLRNVKDTCPSCGQTIRDKESAVKHAKKEIAELSIQLAKDKKSRKKWKHKRDLAHDAVIIMRESEKAFGKMSDDSKDKYDHLTKSMAETDKDIAVLKTKNRDDQQNPFETAIENARSRVKRYQKDRKAALELADVWQRRMTRYEYWINGFKQVRLYLLQEALEELQETTQNMLPDMGLTGWTVQYDIERETKKGEVATGLTVAISKPGMTKAVKWEAWSGGENQRLLICGALALSDVLLSRMGIECPQIVLDEPTRHMSKEGVNDLVDYLVELGRSKGVYYVDHTAIESARFEEVITIIKDEQGARIETSAN